MDEGRGAAVPASLAARAAVIGMASVFGLTYSLTASVIALDLAGRGVGEAVIGANAAMHAVGVLIAAPLLPGIVSRYGARPVVLAALLVNAVVLVALPLSPVWAWFPLRVVLGLCAEALFVMSETWTTQFSGDRDRGRAMAAYMTSMSLGFAAGPAIVSVVGAVGAAPWVIGVLCTVATAGLASLPGIPRLAMEDVPSKDPRQYLVLAPLGLASASLNSGIEAAGLSFLPLYAMGLGWGEEEATRLIATLMVGAIFLQLPIGWLADHMDRRRLVVGLATLAGVGALAWPLVLHDRMLAYGVVFVWGGLLVGIYTTFLTILGSRFTGSTLVGVYAAIGMAWGVGALVGPLLVGTAASVTVHALPLVAAAACLVFALVAARRREAA